MSDAYDILDILQADVTAILKAVPALADAAVLSDDEGDIEADVIKNLGPLNAGETGKRGLCLVVMAPEAENALPDTPGPQMEARMDIQVIESVAINRGATGTGIRAAKAAVLALNALHLQILGPCSLWCDAKPIVPVRVKKGYQSRTVTMRTRIGLPGSGKVSAVAAQADGSSLALSTSTAGATIYYTTDGSYPAPSNTAAIEYEGAVFDLPADTQIRAAAYAAGLNPSDVTSLLIEGLEPATWGNITIPWGEITVPWGELS
jgi:hypothetical protein